MYKQVFNKQNGKPQLVESIYNEESKEIEFKYDKEQYTDIAPPHHLYEPIQYLNDEWVGETEDEYRIQNPITPQTHQPNYTEKMNAQTQMEVAKIGAQLKHLQKEYIKSLKTLEQKDQRIRNLEKTQAQTMLNMMKKDKGDDKDE